VTSVVSKLQTLKARDATYNLNQALVWSRPLLHNRCAATWGQMCRIILNTNEFLMSRVVFRVTTPCNDVKGHQYSGGPWRLHLQDRFTSPHDVRTQETISMRTTLSSKTLAYYYIITRCHNPQYQEPCCLHLNPVDGGSNILHNTGIAVWKVRELALWLRVRTFGGAVTVLHHYKAPQPRLPQTTLPPSHPEDGSTFALRNVGILPHPYMVSVPRRPRLQSPSLLTRPISECVTCKLTTVHEVW
jgi:hypothetical protein